MFQYFGQTKCKMQLFFWSVALRKQCRVEGSGWHCRMTEGNWHCLISETRMSEICLSLSRVVAVALTRYEEIYREQIRQLSKLFLKALFGGNVTCKCLKFSSSSLFLLKIRPLPTKKAYKYVIKESVPFFFQIACVFVSFITGAVKVSILKITILNLLHSCIIWS